MYENNSLSNISLRGGWTGLGVAKVGGLPLCSSIPTFLPPGHIVPVCRKKAETKKSEGDNYIRYMSPMSTFFYNWNTFGHFQKNRRKFSNKQSSRKIIMRSFTHIDTLSCPGYRMILHQYLILTTLWWILLFWLLIWLHQEKSHSNCKHVLSFVLETRRGSQFHLKAKSINFQHTTLHCWYV